jgi:hypothetical protein
LSSLIPFHHSMVNLNTLEKAIDACCHAGRAGDHIEGSFAPGTLRAVGL